MSPRSERGSVMPFVLALSSSLLALVVVLMVVGGALVAQRRVRAAADLSALAGAAAVQHGRDGCAAVLEVARRNDAAVTTCVVEGTAVLVRLTREAPVMLGRHVRVQAQARAGPMLP